MNAEIREKLILAGALHSLSFNCIFSSFYAPPDERTEEFKSLEETFDGTSELLRSIGVDSGEFKFPRSLYARNPVSTALTWARESTLPAKIREMYGRNAANVYIVSRYISTAHLIADLMGKIHDLGPVGRQNRRFVNSQSRKAHAHVKELGSLLGQSQEAIRIHIGDEVADGCARFSVAASKVGSDSSLKSFKLVHEETSFLMNSLLPRWPIVNEDILRARELRDELGGLSVGVEHWRAYESLCIKILHFLFVPPFRRVYVQSRTADGHERRDAVLSNNNFNGFWGLVRSEFNARHVVCEFKNGKDGQSKDALNQLRLYLGRRAIGGFGLLFVRRPPSASLLRAQRAAYDQNALILVVDDELVSRLLSARAYARSADSVLEDEKTKFELSY